MKKITIQVLWKHVGNDYYKLFLIVPGTDSCTELGQVFQAQSYKWIALTYSTLPTHQEFDTFEAAQDWVEEALNGFERDRK